MRSVMEGAEHGEAHLLATVKEGQVAAEGVVARPHVGPLGELPRAGDRVSARHHMRTMRHAPCTMHHAPCTMHHAPCTMHHAPCIVHTVHRAPFP